MSHVANINTLTAYFREFSKDKTNSEIITHLFECIGDKIQIRYEVVNNCTSEVDIITDTNTTANQCSDSLASSEDTTGGRFDHLNKVKLRRLILTTNRKTADFRTLLQQECNGLVIDLATWEVVSVPPPMFNSNFKTYGLSHEFRKYYIYEVIDGTIVTLYYYDNQWCMSSTHGFDIRDYKWMDNITYGAAFDSVLNAYNFTTDKLKTNCCYTIGFRHGSLHPLPTDKSRAWLVQAYDISNKTYLKTSEVLAEIEIPSQKIAEITAKTPKDAIKQMINANKTSLTKYLEAISTAEGIKNPPIHYGYILRGKFEHHHEYANIMLESELLKKIRQLVYSLPKTQDITIDHTNRLDYLIIRAFLSVNSKALFMGMFPNFGAKYDRYNGIISKVCDKVYYSLRNQSVKDEMKVVLGKKLEANESDEIRVTRIALDLLTIISKNNLVNAFDSNGHGIIMDLITDPSYVGLYAKYLLTY